MQAMDGRNEAEFSVLAEAPSFRWTKMDPGFRRDDEQILECGEIRVRRHEPLRSRVGEVHLDAGVRAGAFGADHHAFSEAGVAHALAEFDGQGVVEVGVAARRARGVHRPRDLRARTYFG